MSQKLTEAIKKMNLAESNAITVLKREYPVESMICWERNGIHRGEVLAHSGGHRVKVKNSRTGGELWIYMQSIR